MRLFLGCKERFPDKPDLLRNMMGLLGNVAEVPSLRPALMTSEFVAEFYHLLSSTSDGIEVRLLAILISSECFVVKANSLVCR